ncbi:hypothetical protein [Deinococcus sp. Marseille-Q6407]|uniref:hypothetical protein n=1 Tax=Deinococcus sp. Marseille-Q6407 TaxID=2969223 RepID=UPI0021BE463C|nr:hypothetical protein [Deinococcus sp. Marseille-Q6407]
MAQLLCHLRSLPGRCRERLSVGPFPGARAIVFAAVLLVSIVALHRPYLPQLLPGYSRFDDLMPFAWWGWAGLILAAFMLGTKPGSPLGLTVNFCLSVYLFAIAGAFMAGVGLTFAPVAFLVLGVAALLLFGADFQAWFPKIAWVQRLAEHPPKAVRKWFDGRP